MHCSEVSAMHRNYIHHTALVLHWNSFYHKSIHRFTPLERISRHSYVKTISYVQTAKNSAKLFRKSIIFHESKKNQSVYITPQTSTSLDNSQSHDANDKRKSKTWPPTIRTSMKLCSLGLNGVGVCANSFTSGRFAGGELIQNNITYTLI